MSAEDRRRYARHVETKAWLSGQPVEDVAAAELDRPRHQPPAPEAPIPGRQWFGGCDPDGGHVRADGICDGCGERACPVCGAGFYPDGGCQCPEPERPEVDR